MAYTPIDANSTSNAVLILPRGGFVNAVHAINPNAATRFVQFFDAAAATDVTLGTTIPRYSLSVGTSASAEGLVGSDIVFINGIVVAGTTTAVNATTASMHVRVWVA